MELKDWTSARKRRRWDGTLNRPGYHLIYIHCIVTVPVAKYVQHFRYKLDQTETSNLYSRPCMRYDNKQRQSARKGTMYTWRLRWGGVTGLAKFWPQEGRLRKFGTDKGEGEGPKSRKFRRRHMYMPPKMTFLIIQITLTLHNKYSTYVSTSLSILLCARLCLFSSAHSEDLLVQ